MLTDTEIIVSINLADQSLESGVIISGHHHATTFGDPAWRVKGREQRFIISR